MEIYRDTYEDTPFDMTKFMIVPEADGPGLIVTVVGGPLTG